MKAILNLSGRDRISSDRHTRKSEGINAASGQNRASYLLSVSDILESEKLAGSETNYPVFGNVCLEINPSIDVQIFI